MNHTNYTILMIVYISKVKNGSQPMNSSVRIANAKNYCVKPFYILDPIYARFFAKGSESS